MKVLGRIVTRSWLRRVPGSGFASVAVLSLLLAACSSNGASPAQGGSSPGSSPGVGVEQTIDVRMTAALRFEPAEVTVRAGERVRFRVTNVSQVDHEFYVDDEAAQQAHGEQVLSAGGALPDGPTGILVLPGTTKELVYSAERAGQLVIGCHLAGHYLAGMKATLRIEP